MYKERIEKLNQVITQLKSEFIGLDNIIDEIGDSISAWYVTPEVIHRPVVISLWGMTGTGKSSVVRRLIELLELNNKTLFFDCGECAGESTNIASNISDTFGFDDDVYRTPDPRFVFVWDEFQNARSLKEDGEEEIKPSLRPIWKLLDSGILDINDSYSWDFNRLMVMMDNMIPFCENYPDLPVKGLQVEDRDAVKVILENVGLACYSDRDIPGITVTEVKGDDEDPYKPLSLIRNENLKTILDKLHNIQPDFNISDYLERDWTLGEFGVWLEELRSKMSRPKSIDCSQSLIFVIGNLDEAFSVGKDMNPDIDADVFYDITKRVSITDIKDALKKRFRPEQIARLGNNLIKYPTLTSNSFKKIIALEVNKLLEGFSKVSKIEVLVDQSVYDLLYSEGVYPTQGVRPVFTTIGSIFTPIFSKILIKEENGDTKVTLKAEGNLAADSIKIKLDFGTHVFEYDQPLQLGRLRNPKNRKKRYACSVHEAGHAVVYAYLYGQAPNSIVAVSSDNGGFCSTYNQDAEGEIDSKVDVENDIMVSLGGYCAEKVFFDEEHLLMGSGQDLQDAWETFSDAVYNTGLYYPRLFASRYTDNNTPVPNGFDSKKIEEEMENNMNEFEERTTWIIKRNKDLIKELALYLGEYGSMGSEKFMEFVKKFGGDLENHMKDKRESLSSEWYYNKIWKI